MFKGNINIDIVNQIIVRNEQRLLTHPEDSSAKNIVDVFKEVLSKVESGYVYELPDTKCVDCGSKYGEEMWWNHGEGRYTIKYLCSGCTTKFAYGQFMLGGG